NLQTIAGGGVTAVAADGYRLFVGNEKLMTEKRIKVASFEETVATARRDGGTPLFVARESQAPTEPQLLGVIVTADSPHPTARDAVAALNKLGLKILLLSGDHRTTAEAVARQVGIRETIAEVLPAEKQAT